MSGREVGYGPVKWFEEYSDAARYADSGGIAIVGVQGEYAKYAIFACPCGANAEGQEHNGFNYRINLSSAHKPNWTYEVHEDGTLTLSPSILDLGHCKSHYFIQRSKVVWA